MGKPVNLDETNFDQAVLKSPVPMLVDFWAEHCGPCRMVAPIIDELAKEYDGRFAFGKVDVDEHPKIAVKYGVMNIPNLIIFKNGKAVSNLVGSKSRAELKRNLDVFLK